MASTPTVSSEQPELQRQFPILEHGLYVNHAAIAPWPLCTAEAVARFAKENAQVAAASYGDWIARENGLRASLARFIGAPSDGDIALLKNTTEGISLVACGVDWRAGNNIVIPAREFSSNRRPCLACEEWGVELREVDIREGQNPEATLIDAMDEQTRVLSVSAVHWGDGLRLDLERIGDACRSGGVLFFVDAIQQLGALPLDVSACKIDCLAADAHKWLLGPEGIAVFFCREDIRPQLKLRQHGWHMFDNPWRFADNGLEPSKSARRFEAGSPNSLGQVALEASLGLLMETGMDTVARRILANSDYLIRNLTELPGVRITGNTDPDRRSGIVSFVPGDIPPHSLHRALGVNGVTCALRDGAIRLSPHYYQGEEELARLVASIEAAMTANC
jgi:selenocysteine lyase/cysteine desulfurase